MQELSLTVNGRPCTVHVDPATTLAEVLRDELGLTGTKIGCDRGACSACTVWLDGEVVASCMTLRARRARPADHDHRGTRARRAASSGAAGLRRARRHAVRLLHARHGDELRGAGRAQSRLHARRCERRSQRPSVSLRHLSEHLQGDAGGRSAHVQRSARVEAAHERAQTHATSRTVPDRHRRRHMLEQVTRNVPGRRAAALPPNAKLRVIGKPVDRARRACRR